MADIPTVRIIRFPTALLLVVLLGLEACTLQPTDDQIAHSGRRTQPATASEADLTKFVAELKQPETRMQGFAELLALAESLSYLRGDYSTGDADAEALRQKAYEAVRRCPDLEGTVAGFIRLLGQKDSRMRAMLVLMQFAGAELYQGGSGIYGGTGDVKFDELRSRAAAAVHQCADVESVSQALDFPDRSLQFWGVSHFGGREPTEAQTNTWAALLPRLKALAVGADATIRSAAIRKLMDYPEARGFLANRVELETAPEVLMELMRPQTPLDQFNQAFVERLCSLLDHPDERVRHDALLFVGDNSNRAPIWRFTFDAGVFDRVVKLTRSRSAEVRSAAACALTEIRRLDLDRSREAFLRLAKDTSSEVRWRVGFGLADELDREDVRPVISALLQDDNPGVRYMTISAVRVEKHFKELQQMAQSPNKQIANWAVETLKQLEHPPSPPWQK